jgi:hypothetical protein
MNDDDLRRRAAVVREVPLETVLLLRGAVRDPRDGSDPKSFTGQVPFGTVFLGVSVKVAAQPRLPSTW